MKRLVPVVFLSFFFQQLAAQKIRMILPQQPVVAGTAFQVQYVITDPSGLINIISPSFDSMQVVSGPNHYKGNMSIDGRSHEIENITYTLVASHAGVVKVNALEIVFKNGIEEKSNEGFVHVMPRLKASYISSSSYTDISLYAPASKTDLDKLIGENLFVKTEVSKTNCFVGEAVVVSYVLYSRLQARSEVINAPSLYGFGVMDMLNVNEAHQSVRTIGNKIFNIAILRKLQLYPEQIGKLVVDEMQLQNEIEFDDPTQAGNTVKVERLLVSKPVTVTVKALPDEKPLNYTGAVGNFSIQSYLEKNKIATNQQGRLTIKIAGKGNFIQFGSPVIQWPQGFDVFDPVINDALNKSIAPLAGSREYVFNFVNDSMGSYTLPPVAFSFFDPVSKTFKTLRTDSLQLEIVKAEAVAEQDKQQFSGTRKKYWVFVVIGFLVITGGIWFYKRERSTAKIQPSVTKPDLLGQIVLLDFSKMQPKQSCLEIQKITRKVHQEHQLTPGQKKEIQAIESDCQLLAYADIDAADRREELKLRVIRLLQSIS